MGWNGRILEGKLQIIYLSESLEGKTREDCKLAIAHELAHSILGHTDSPSSDVIENEAWQKVIALGLATQEQVDDFRGRHNLLATQS